MSDATENTVPKATQGKYWILTIPGRSWSPPKELPSTVVWLKGQKEIGEGGFEHWQVVVGFARKTRLRGVKDVFGREAHAELTRSAAAEEYVHKFETRVDGKEVIVLINLID